MLVENNEGSKGEPGGWAQEGIPISFICPLSYTLMVNYAVTLSLLARQVEYPNLNQKRRKGLLAGSNGANRPGWRALLQVLMSAEEQVPSSPKEMLIPSHNSAVKSLPA